MGRPATANAAQTTRARTIASQPARGRSGDLPPDVEVERGIGNLTQPEPGDGRGRRPAAAARVRHGYRSGWWGCWSDPAAPAPLVALPRCSANEWRSCAAACAG